MQVLRVVAALTGMLSLAAEAEVIEGWQHGSVTHRIEVNVGEDLCPRIDSGLALLELEPLRLNSAEGKSQTLEVTLATGDALGLVASTLKLQPCDGGVAQSRSLTTFVQSIFDDERPLLEFGRLSSGVEASREWRIASRQQADVRLLRIESVDSGVQAELAEDGELLRVTLTDALPWGTLQGQIRLATSSSLQPELLLEWRAQRLGEVTADPSVLRLGVSIGADPATRLIHLRRNDGQKLVLGETTIPTDVIALSRQRCEVGGDECVVLHLSFDLTSAAATTESVLRVALPEFDRQLQIPVHARVSIAAADAEPTPIDAASARPSADSRLREAMRRVVEQPRLPGDGPLLSWRVRNEQQAFGYLIHRAESPEGPFQRINEQIVRASDVSQGRYQWRDSSYQPGTTYYYSIDVISLQGRKSRLSEVIRRDAE